MKPQNFPNCKFKRQQVALTNLVTKGEPTTPKAVTKANGEVLKLIPLKQRIEEYYNELAVLNNAVMVGDRRNVRTKIRRTSRRTQ